ncbi:ABC transporter ATP-binding protein [Ruminococcus sp. YE282]|uniref:ABC transporter ATP-binding protein n=1 Tax=Ruminococcus sp. YE282 TaxID=3158780 RepID=UPI00088C1D8C|nr:ABC-2 type transport system ATP-binding protein [Ruminococcus bromii]
MKCIEINELSKVIAGKIILDKVTFHVDEGEIFGLLGPSGAGKTTIMNILCGQRKATSGQTIINGIKSEMLPDDVLKNIGIMFDDYSLYDRLSCFDNLLLITDILKIDKNEIFNVLRKVGLEDSKDKAVSKLSKGMKQRLLFARAIIHKPKLLFLDEPTSSLDPSTTLLIHNVIRDLKKEKTTVFLTTHNMHEAHKLCDNIALLSNGKIVEYGNPDEICLKYQSELEVALTFDDGRIEKLFLTNKNIDILYNYLKNNCVKSIHSSDVNLETIFIKLTGKGLK